MSDQAHLLHSDRGGKLGLTGIETKYSNYVELKSREPSTAGHRSTDNISWKTSLWRLSPILGLTALLLAVGCMVASLCLLQRSNNQSLEHWLSLPFTFQKLPSVWLSTANVATNTLIRFALGSALPVVWWRHAMKGTTLAFLHTQWASGTSIYQALGSVTKRRNLGLVAIASIVTALLAVTPPLLQAASSIELLTPNITVPFEVGIAPELPRGWAGNVTAAGSTYVTDRRANDALISYLYNDTMYMEQPYDSWCPGRCQIKVLGPGLEKSCVTTNQSFTAGDMTTLPYFENGKWLYFAVKTMGHINQSDGSSTWHGPKNIAEPSDVPMPDLTREVAVIEIVVADQDDDFPATVAATQCFVRSAILEYEVAVANDMSVTFVTRPTDPPFVALANNTVGFDEQEGDYPSILNVLFSNLGGSFNTEDYQNDQGQWVTDNLTGFGMAHIIMLDPGRNGFKAMDPLDNLMAAYNEIMFRGGLSVAWDRINVSIEDQTHWMTENLDDGLSLSQKVNGIPIDRVSTIVSNKLYWAAAATIQAFAILMILPLFWGYWRMGRDMSLSPIETAKAFQAPLLEDLNSNADGDAIEEKCRDIQFRYGALSITGKGKLAEESGAGVLGFDARLNVTRPRKDQEFV